MLWIEYHLVLEDSMLIFGYRFNNRRLFHLALLAGAGFVSLSPAVMAQGAHSASPVNTAAVAEDASAKRFPQKVRVGDLAERLVLEPSQHQSVLGRVDSVSRDAGGRLFLVVRYGGLLGFGTRKIAVPLETTTLLGPFVQIVDIPEEEVAKLPTLGGASTEMLGANEIVRVGINRN
jgi:hypothetical protein